MEYIVYDGDLVGWVECSIIKFNSNTKRATVKTSNGTVLTRFLKCIDSENDKLKDGCVYAIKKPTQN